VVGDGVLSTYVDDFAKEHKINSIYQMGFQKRTDIGKFYASADFLILPSYNETWGIVVNEALCFSLPVIVSDQVGAGIDLVFPGENGHIFESGSATELSGLMSKLMDLPQKDRLKMGEASGNIIETWINRDLSNSLIEYIEGIQATSFSSTEK
jgi:glycosyltransferase involved in cell wall biosynthesis